MPGTGGIIWGIFDWLWGLGDLGNWVYWVTGGLGVLGYWVIGVVESVSQIEKVVFIYHPG